MTTDHIQSNPKKKKSKRSKSKYNIGVVICSILLAVISFILYKKSYMLSSRNVYKDCEDYFRYGFTEDRVYEITPTQDSDFKLNAFCNMTAGGWTMLMQRDRYSTNDIDWRMDYDTYVNGFGELKKDHFLGLNNIHLLTRNKARRLMILIDSDQYEYENFKVLNEYYHFKLVIDKQVGMLHDEPTMLRLNNSYFSAYDVDFDTAINFDCSSDWNAGWWFTDCFDRSMCLTCLSMHEPNGVESLDYVAMLIK